MKRSAEPPAMPPLIQEHSEDGFVGYLLMRASVALRRRTEREFNAFGITPPQFSVLVTLDRYPGVSNADIARLSFTTPQTVSVIIANLERIGAVVRRPHAVHGRIQHIDVTDKGVALLHSGLAPIHAIEEQLLDGLKPHEERIIRRWLFRHAQRIDERCQSHGAGVLAELEA